MADAFADYVVARQRALLRSAWLLTGDWALAEDLVQTALIKVWPRFARVAERGDPDRRYELVVGPGQSKAFAEPLGGFLAAGWHAVPVYGMAGSFDLRVT